MFIFSQVSSETMLSQEELVYDDENVVFLEKTHLEQESFQAKVEIPEWLEHAESPFKWLKTLSCNLIQFKREKILKKANKKHGLDYGFERFILHLTLVVMDSLETKEEEPGGSGSGEEIDPQKTYKELEGVVEEMRAKEGDTMYGRIGPALEHILIATRANMLHLMGRDDESEQVAKNIVLLESMCLESKAGLNGVKAALLEHIYQDDRTLSLEASKSAMELDPDFAYWKYRTAKIMRQQRKRLMQKMKCDELEYLQMAVQLDNKNNPLFMVFLARGYQEMALQQRDRKVKDEMYQKSVELYRESYRLKSDCLNISRRVGNGLIKIKGKFGDVELATEALHKAVELSPTSVRKTYHTLGKLYLYTFHDEERGLQYFEQVRGDYCTAEIIRYKLLKDSNCDISEYIRYWSEFVEGYDEENNIYCNIVWYYLYYEQNILQAVTFLWKVLKKDPESIKVLKFTSYSFFVKTPLNLLEIVLNQILLYKEENSVRWVELDGELLNNFLEKIWEKHPNLRHMNPNPNILPDMKREIDRFRSWARKPLKARSNATAVVQQHRQSAPRNVNQESRNRNENQAVPNWRTQNNGSNRGFSEDSWDRLRYYHERYHTDSAQTARQTNNTSYDSASNEGSFTSRTWNKP